MSATVTIEAWLAVHPFPGFLEPLRALTEEFNRAHQGHRVVLRGIDFREMPEAVARAAREGRRPAIAEYYTTSTQLARDTRDDTGRPLFTPVQRAIGGRSEILGEPVVIDDIMPVIRDYYSYDGELVSVPVTATTAVLYANRTLLEAAGVAEVPATWRAMTAACRAIARLPGGPPAATWADHGWLFQQAIASQGGLLADRDNGRAGRATQVRLASAEMLAFADWWHQLHWDGHYLYTGSRSDWHSAFDAFAAQRVALMVSSSVDVRSAIECGQDAGFEVAVGRLPYNDDVRYAGNVLSGQSMWLADGLDADTRDGALAFMMFLIKGASAAAWHRASGFVPVTGAARGLLEREGWFAAHPAHRVAIDQLLASDRSPAALGALLGDFAGIQDEITLAMEDVLVRQSDPAGRFQVATGQAQQLLDEYNADCLRARTPALLRVG
jgi:sn-glycerol 3-phosphate transport system substrate-binding protein